ncbi:MAG: hypothetical protein ACF8R9_08825 [Phycisphaerales bacterium JB054]
MAVAQARGTKSTRRTTTRPGLRLARTDAGVETKPEASGRSPEPGTVAHERRGTERVRARGQGVATFVDPDGRLWLTRVTLVDRCGGGLGVRCPVKVSPGASVRCSVDGQTEFGTVAHTRGRGGAYRLGLRLERRLAA